MKKAILAGLLCTLPMAAMAEEISLEQRKAQSMGEIKEFFGKLKGELGAAMKSGGPLNAIDVCHKAAPSIAQDMSNRTGWDVARTSLKTRNSGNAPDAWESAVLKDFEQRKAKGEDVETMSYWEVVSENGNDYYRFMKAIPTGDVCLKCHGADIDPKVAAKLDELYPNDMARGFKLGDIRGAFTIKQPM